MKYVSASAATPLALRKKNASEGGTKSTSPITSVSLSPGITIVVQQRWFPIGPSSASCLRKRHVQRGESNIVSIPGLYRNHCLHSIPN